MNRPLITSGRRGARALAAFCVALLLAAGMSVVAARGAAAQANGDELGAYLDRTDELIEWAAERVAASGSEQARRVLEQARLLQLRSRDLAGRGRLLDAFSLGRRAREALWHAVRLARDAAGMDERIRQRLEHFADQHALLTERALDGGQPRAVELLDRAREQARRAREWMLQGDLHLSWKLLERADELLRLAARLLADGAGPERLQQDLERTRQLLDEATDRLAGATVPAGILAELAEAREALTRAESAAAAGDPGLALQMSALARRQTQRALSRTGELPDGEAVQRLFDRFDERAAQVAERLRDGADEPSRRAFARAVDERAAAARALDEGKVDAALRHVRSAHDRLDQAERGLR